VLTKVQESGVIHVFWKIVPTSFLIPYLRAAKQATPNNKGLEENSLQLLVVMYFMLLTTYFLYLDQMKFWFSRIKLLILTF